MKISTHIPNHNLQLPLIQILTQATFVQNCGAKPVMITFNTIKYLKHNRIRLLVNLDSTLVLILRIRDKKEYFLSFLNL